MSSNMIGRAREFRVKVGSTNDLIVTITDYTGIAKSLNDTSKYATAYFKVWKPNGTLIIDSQADYSDRPSGEITYTLTSADTDIENAGVWEGEVETRDDFDNISDQSETFNFIIEESY